MARPASTAGKVREERRRHDEREEHHLADPHNEGHQMQPSHEGMHADTGAAYCSVAQLVAGWPGNGLRPENPAVERVVVGDLLLAVLPAQQHDLTVDLARKVDEAKVEALQLAAARVDLAQQGLQLLDDRPQARGAAPGAGRC